MKKALILVLASVTGMSVALGAYADDYITLASTTSTQNSGLFDAILPQFEEAAGIDVRVVAVGTGQAFEIARRGDADSLLVHDTAGEKRFVENGFASERADVMYNDFVLIGPANDPANIGKAQSAAEAFAAIAHAKAPFTSRGDDSGTNRAELRLWE
ncbi:substrate-binding domain-containing protein, partial [Marinobacter sp.]